MGRLVKAGPPWDVGPWVSQAQAAALQSDMDRVHKGGVEGLGIIAVRLIHPALRMC